MSALVFSCCNFPVLAGFFGMCSIRFGLLSVRSVELHNIGLGKLIYDGL